MGVMVRNGVFETNSSSTHSLSIKDIRDYKDLVIDGVLHPENLSTFCTVLDNGYDYVLLCDTYEKKLALLAHWVRNENLTEDLDDPDFLINYLEKISDYRINKDFRSQFSSFCEDENIDIQTINKLESFYYNIICNSNKIINSTVIEW